MDKDGVPVNIDSTTDINFRLVKIDILRNQATSFWSFRLIIIHFFDIGIIKNLYFIFWSFYFYESEVDIGSTVDIYW